MILLFILNITLTSSAYFTIGDFSDQTRSFSTAVYATTHFYQHYLMFGYDNYQEKWQYYKLTQHQFSLGYTKTFYKSLNIRTTGFYHFNSHNNIGIALTNRISYGYRTVASIGYSYAVYSSRFQSQRNFHYCHQLNPEFFYYLSYRNLISFGLFYTNTEQENYFAYSSKISYSPVAPLQLEASLIYGKIFYHIDDRLMIINNRPSIQTSGIGLKAKYLSIIKNINLIGIFKSNKYTTYSVNYYALGVEYER